MEAKWDEMRQMLTLRAELRRLADAPDGVADAELQSWPEDDGDQFPDWLTTSPEAAAAENLSYWTDDE